MDMNVEEVWKDPVNLQFWSASSDSNTHLCCSGPRCLSRWPLLGSPSEFSGWSGCLAASSSSAGRGEWSDSPAKPGYPGEAATGATRTLQTRYTNCILQTYGKHRRITTGTLCVTIGKRQNFVFVFLFYLRPPSLSFMFIGGNSKISNYFHYHFIILVIFQAGSCFSNERICCFSQSYIKRNWTSLVFAELNTKRTEYITLGFRK